MADIDHPTPVQGEPLPVVALKRYVTGFEHGTWFCREDAEGNWCDYQEATAEIAKRDEVIERHSKTLERIARQDIPAWQAERTTLRQQLSTALAESGETDPTLPFESALSELIDKIVPGLDSGDVLADAHTASSALDRAENGKLELVNCLREFLGFYDKPCTIDAPRLLDNKQFGEFLKNLDDNRDAMIDKTRKLLARHTTTQESADND